MIFGIALPTAITTCTNTAGASAQQNFAANTAAAIEATVAELKTQRVFGLAEGYTNRDLASVKYGFLLNGATLYIRANGTQYTVAGTLASA